MISNKKILWSINVYNQLDHLKLLETCIRDHFHHSLDIHVFCNVDEKELGKYMDLSEDLFDWLPN